MRGRRPLMRNTTRHDLVLALVGAIRPHRGVMDDRTIKAVDMRRAQYLEIFARALHDRPSANDYSIVFAENSGTDLQEFEDLAGRHRNVEVMSHPSPLSAV